MIVSFSTSFLKLHNQLTFKWPKFGEAYNTNWDTAELSDRPLNEKILELKQQPGKNILAGSRSLIIQLLNSNLIDEFQICIHPIIEGKGLKLFDQITKEIMLKLVKTKTLNSGATIFYYEPIRE